MRRAIDPAEKAYGYRSNSSVKAGASFQNARFADGVYLFVGRGTRVDQRRSGGS